MVFLKSIKGGTLWVGRGRIPEGEERPTPRPPPKSAPAYINCASISFFFVFCQFLYFFETLLAAKSPDCRNIFQCSRFFNGYQHSIQNPRMFELLFCYFLFAGVSENHAMLSLFNRLDFIPFQDYIFEILF